jgi:hypothetical protein
MPQHIPGRHRIRDRGGMRALLRNGRFLALCCAYGSYLLAYNQLYLALPDDVQRAAGSQAPLSWLFALPPCWSSSPNSRSRAGRATATWGRAERVTTHQTAADSTSASNESRTGSSPNKQFMLIEQVGRMRLRRGHRIVGRDRRLNFRSATSRASPGDR